MNDLAILSHQRNNNFNCNCQDYCQINMNSIPVTRAILSSDDRDEDKAYHS